MSESVAHMASGLSGLFLQVRKEDVMLLSYSPDSMAGMGPGCP